jgi:REP element-mobilizing transposase RayT
MYSPDVQQLLFRNGGARRGAGRKPAGLRAGMPHAARPTISSALALHVTIRALAAIPPLRQPAMYAAIRAASVAAARQRAFRVVHISIQNTHVHLIVEADDKGALARGMQSFQSSAARRINATIDRRGRVFTDRYHLVVIRSPTQMRNVLAYVLTNFRKHRAHHAPRPGWLVDPYSTGFAFDGWAELATGAALWPETVAAHGLVVKAAHSWLLTTGWRRAGGDLSVDAMPGKRPD